MTNKNKNDTGSPAQLTLADGSHDSLQATLRGDWLLGNALPDADQVTERFTGTSGVQRIDYATPDLGRWDSGLMTFLVSIQHNANDAGIAVEPSGLPEGAQKLLQLAFAVKEREGAARSRTRTPVHVAVGNAALELGTSLAELVSFIGELVMKIHF